MTTLSATSIFQRLVTRLFARQTVLIHMMFHYACVLGAPHRSAQKSRAARNNIGALVSQARDLTMSDARIISLRILKSKPNTMKLKSTMVDPHMSYSLNSLRGFI